MSLVALTLLLREDGKKANKVAIFVPDQVLINQFKMRFEDQTLHDGIIYTRDPEFLIYEDDVDLILVDEADYQLRMHGVSFV